MPQFCNLQTALSYIKHFDSAYKVYQIVIRNQKIEHNENLR